LTLGNFNENGEVNLSNQYFDQSKWTDYHQYGKIMTVGQAIGLVISVSLFLGVLSYIIYLQRALVHRKPWKKPALNKLSQAYLAGRLSRNNSEITGARSRPDDASTITYNSMH
jgi:hypothetical protein